MATYEDVLAGFKEEMKEMGLSYHEGLYHEITKYLGPSIYQRDSSLVACSDPKELETIKTNFLIGKLGLEDGPELDKALQEVCGGMGKSNRNKHRATFYYLLVGILHKESVFIDTGK